MVSLRKDTCANFKRKFLAIYKARKNSAKVINGWESLMLSTDKNAKKGTGAKGKKNRNKLKAKA
jgi:hypothetical protein